MTVWKATGTRRANYTRCCFWTSLCSAHPSCSHLVLPHSSPVISGFTPVNSFTHQRKDDPVDDGPRNVGPRGKARAQPRAPKRPRQLGTPPPTTKRSRKNNCLKHPSKVKSGGSSNNDITQILRATQPFKPNPIEKDFVQSAEASVSTELSEHTLSRLAAFEYRQEAANDDYGVHNSEILESNTSVAESLCTPEGNAIDTADPITVRCTPGTFESEVVPHKRTYAVSTLGCLPSIEAVHCSSTASGRQTRIDISSSIPADENNYHVDTLSSSENESLDRAFEEFLTGIQKEGTNHSTLGKQLSQDQGCYADMNEKTRELISYDELTKENEISNGRDEQFFAEASYEHKATLESSPSMLLGHDEYDEYSNELPAENLGYQASPHANDVQETFEPPSDLQLSYDDPDQRSEIYNAIVRCSSPHSERSFVSLQVGEEIFSIGQQTTVNALRSSGRLFSAYEDSTSNKVVENGMDDAHDEGFPAIEDVCEDEEDLLNDELDSSVVELADKACTQPRQTLLPPFNDEPGTPKLQWRAPQLYKPTRSSPVSSNFNESSPIFKTPVSTLLEVHSEAQCNESLAKHHVGFDSNGKALPFARPVFPPLIRDRSPILGLSNSSCLRTCFRIGEALNAATVASHTNMHHLTELYARVTYSKRDGVEQYFQFADLFRPERPPYLNGSYIGWKGSDLWEADTKSFLVDLKEGKLARCIGKMKRDQTTRVWKMVILNIWEATWEDVGYVKGIVCA